MPDVRERQAHLPSPLGRLIAIVLSAGLAWAIVVALAAWVFGFFLAGN